MIPMRILFCIPMAIPSLISTERAVSPRTEGRITPPNKMWQGNTIHLPADNLTVCLMSMTVSSSLFQLCYGMYIQRKAPVKQDKPPWVLRMWFWECGFQNVVLRMWFWECDCENVILRMWLWECDFENVILRMWLWECDFENVVLRMWFWECDFENVGLRMWLWECDFENVGFIHSICAHTQKNPYADTDKFITRSYTKTTSIWGIYIKTTYTEKSTRRHRQIYKEIE